MCQMLFGGGVVWYGESEGTLPGGGVPSRWKGLGIEWFMF